MTESKQWNSCVTAINNQFGAASHEFKNEKFLDAIWNVSTVVLPGLEVSVIVDRDNNLFCSYGSPGYVDYSVPPKGMKIPIKCWIHTHPFGKAYWSSTDWNTIHIWKSIMEYAIVLGGDNEMHWFKKGRQEYCKRIEPPVQVSSLNHVRNGYRSDLVGEEE
jgi:hypothetical protein